MKNILFFVLLLLIFPACNNEETTNFESANKAIVKESFDYFNKYDWPKMASLYVDNAELWEPSMQQGVTKMTHAQIMEKFTELSKMIPVINQLPRTPLFVKI